MGLISSFRRTGRGTVAQLATPIEAIVESKVAVSDRSALLTLRPQTDEFHDVAPGSHIDVHLDEGMLRQYSIVDLGRTDGSIAVCVQLERDGRGGSARIHSTVEPGMRLRISQPRNTFPLHASTGRALLLAAGVGVTPLVSMATALHRAQADFELHTYATDPASLPLREHLRASTFAPSVTAHYSNSGDSFRTASPALLTSPVSDGMVYVCGPIDFMNEARTRALDAGWRPDQVVSEQFSPQAASTRPTDRSFTVIAASTGQEIIVEADEAIADALERKGIETARSCGQGFCGSCITRVISGIPDHRDDSQTDDEHASNTLINVCCSRSLTSRLELDV